METVLRLGILEGDDIGHEIVPASVAVAKAAAVRTGPGIDGVDVPIGRCALDTRGHAMPPGTLETLETLDGWILGPIGHRESPKVAEAINPHPILRKTLDLFVNVRPTRSHPGIGCLHDDMDLVIVCENNDHGGRRAGAADVAGAARRIGERRLDVGAMR